MALFADVTMRRAAWDVADQSWGVDTVARVGSSKRVQGRTRAERNGAAQRAVASAEALVARLTHQLTEAQTTIDRLTAELDAYKTCDGTELDIRTQLVIPALSWA